MKTVKIFVKKLNDTLVGKKHESLYCDECKGYYIWTYPDTEEIRQEIVNFYEENKLRIDKCGHIQGYRMPSYHWYEEAQN